MEVFTFLNKQQTLLFNILIITSVVFGIGVFLYPDVSTNIYLIYFLINVCLIVYMLKLVRQLSKGIKQIVVEDDSVRLVFFNKMKEPVSVEKQDMSVVVVDDFIEIRKASSDKVIGSAFKKMIKEPKEWNRMVELLS